MTKHSSLGRGLAALIPSKIDKDLVETKEILGPSEKIVMLDVNAIQGNPHQPRKDFDRAYLDDLMNSIKVHGIIQPLVVSKTPAGYQLVVGERRWRAAKALSMKKVPVIVRSVSEQEKLELALVENVQRRNLNPIERAWGYQRLINEFNFTQEEMGKKVGQSRAAVTNSLRLLTLPEEMQKALTDGRITEGHAKVLLGVKSEQERDRLFKEILRHSLTVRDTERARTVVVKKHLRRISKDSKIEAQEQKLREVLGTKVVINKSGQRGRIVIEFYSEEELGEIIKKIIK